MIALPDDPKIKPEFHEDSQTKFWELDDWERFFVGILCGVFVAPLIAVGVNYLFNSFTIALVTGIFLQWVIHTKTKTRDY